MRLGECRYQDDRHFDEPEQSLNHRLHIGCKQGRKRNVWEHKGQPSRQYPSGWFKFRWNRFHYYHHNALLTGRVLFVLPCRKILYFCFNSSQVIDKDGFILL